jgi:hypothetical protein
MKNQIDRKCTTIQFHQINRIPVSRYSTVPDYNEQPGLKNHAPSKQFLKKANVPALRLFQLSEIH